MYIFFESVCVGTVYFSFLTFFWPGRDNSFLRCDNYFWYRSKHFLLTSSNSSALWIEHTPNLNLPTHEAGSYDIAWLIWWSDSLRSTIIVCLHFPSHYTYVHSGYCEMGSSFVCNLYVHHISTIEVSAPLHKATFIVDLNLSVRVFVTVA